MSEFINNCRLEFNGQSFEDFESFSDNEETYAVIVELMNKTGFADKTPRYGFTVTVNRSVDGYPINLKAIKGGTFTVEFPGGARITFGGVRSLSKGEGSIDGDTPLSEAFVFGATSKTDQ